MPDPEKPTPARELPIVPQKVGPCGGDWCRLTLPRQSDGARYCMACDRIIYADGSSRENPNR